MDISRRKFIQSSLAISALTVLPACSMKRAVDEQGKYVYDLTAEPSTAEIVTGFETNILGFNGQIPAPTIRCRQGEKVTIRFTNKLSEPTT
ncbi:multicopper oxidase domain-containing protein, partial [Vibrio sp. 10N.222.51.A6]